MSLNYNKLHNRRTKLNFEEQSVRFKANLTENNQINYYNLVKSGQSWPNLSKKVPKKFKKVSNKFIIIHNL